MLSPGSLDKIFKDRMLVDDTSGQNLNEKDVSLQVKLPARTIPDQPHANESLSKSIFDKAGAESPESLKSSDFSSKKGLLTNQCLQIRLIL